MRRPSLEALQRQLEEDGGGEAIDGCVVEPDGSCEHQQPGALLEFGLIEPATPIPCTRPDTDPVLPTTAARSPSCPTATSG